MTLTIEGITQGYGSNIVLKDISFEVKKGQIVSVLGPNGSGKSTLIRTVCGMLKPRAGTICVEDKDLSSMDRKDFSKMIGYVPQKYVPSDYMTVFDAVLIGRAPYMSWSYSENDMIAAEEAMEKVGIFELAERYINDLSGGQMQKVVLARALAQDPQFYVLDEPTSALDLKNQMVAMNTMRDMVTDGEAGALVALHDLNLALHFSDCVVMLKGGNVYAKGDPYDVINEKAIRDVYEVESEIMEGREGRFVHVLEKINGSQ